MPEEPREPAVPFRHGWGLASKLVVALTVMVLVALGVLVPLNLLMVGRERQREVVIGADHLSKAITSATWNAMLTDHREDAYRAIRAISQQPGIEKIRIFNKEGRVVFSTGPDTGSLVDKHAEACDACHDGGPPAVQLDLESRWRVYRDEEGNRVLGMVTPIYNERSCTAGNCHAHPPAVRVLGVLDVSMSMRRVDQEVSEARTRALLVAAVIMVLAAVSVFLFVRRYVGRPVRHLIHAARGLSEMNLDVPIPIHTHDEIGELAGAFDSMRHRLRDALEEINQFTQGLEQKVEERTAQLAAARETLVRKDRLVSLGQLSASVAHEINNPLSGVLNYTMLMDRILKPEGIPPGRVDEFRRYLSSASQETARVGRIVTSLLSFARQSKPQRTPQDLGELVRATIDLVRHKLEMEQVGIDLGLGELPPVPCDGSQVRQVVMNLVMNAAEAMPKGGRVVVRTFVDRVADAAVLEIQDEGTGISEENLAHVFDPFFTTKPEGQGTGLGLSVVYGIVSGHGGTIDLKSRAGKGTTARVALPLHPPPPAGEPAPEAALRGQA